MCFLWLQNIMWTFFLLIQSTAQSFSAYRYSNKCIHLSLTLYNHKPHQIDGPFTPTDNSSRYKLRLSKHCMTPKFVIWEFAKSLLHFPDAFSICILHVVTSVAKDVKLDYHWETIETLQGLPEGGLRRIILTASGGAFREWPAEKLKTVTVADAIKHPNWSMGKKITVDSASLMNKVLRFPQI